LAPTRHLFPIFAHPDQRVVAHRAGMQNDLVADRHIGAHRGGLSRIGMHDGVVLNVRILADGDPVLIAAQHRAEPDACAFQQAHLADDDRVRRDPVVAFRGKFGLPVAQRIDRHCLFRFLFTKDIASGAGKTRAGTVI